MKAIKAVYEIKKIKVMEAIRAMKAKSKRGNLPLQSNRHNIVVALSPAASPPTTELSILVQHTSAFFIVAPVLRNLRVKNVGVYTVFRRHTAAEIYRASAGKYRCSADKYRVSAYKYRVSAEITGSL